MLSSKTILRAAHCMDGETVGSFQVLVGEHDLTREDGQQRVEVCNIEQHPDYSHPDHDLSILTLCSPLQMSRSVSPVCLPPFPPSFYTGVVATVSGWGWRDYSDRSQPDRLIGVNVTVINNTECNAAYEAYGGVTDNMICARDVVKDACMMDAGGKITLYDLYYSTLGRSPDNHGGWWLLLSDRCGVLGHRMCSASLPRSVYQGYSVLAMDQGEY